MRTVTVRTVCTGTVKETWTLRVPDDWSLEGALDIYADGVEVLSCVDEVSDEGDREVIRHEVVAVDGGAPAPVKPDHHCPTCTCTTVGTYRVVDHITDGTVRTSGTEGQASAVCRELNIMAGPGGRYGVEVMTGHGWERT